MILVLSILFFTFSNFLWKQNLEKYPVYILAFFRAGLNFIIFFSFSVVYFTFFEKYTAVKNLHLILLICLGGASGFFFWLSGLQKLLFSQAIIAGLTSQVLMQIISIFILNENLEANHIFGSIIAMTGFVIFSFHKKSEESISFNGIILILVANSIWAISYSGLSFVLKSNSPLVVANIQELLVMVLAIIAYFITRKSIKNYSGFEGLKINFFKSIFIMSIVSSTAILLGLFALTFTLLSVAATTNLIGPIFSIILAYFVLKEKLSFVQIIASIIVIFGVVLANF